LIFKQAEHQADKNRLNLLWFIMKHVTIFPLKLVAFLIVCCSGSFRSMCVTVYFRCESQSILSSVRVYQGRNYTRYKMLRGKYECIPL